MWRHEQSGFPGEDQGCPTCSFLADSIGDLSHLQACDTTLVLVSRAPIASIERFRKRMGWVVPWYSSYGSDFNYDFHVSFDEDKAPLEYNYKDKETLARQAPYIRSGTDGPGVSVFLREGDRIFHAYSAYERGLDALLGSYRWLRPRRWRRSQRTGRRCPARPRRRRSRQHRGSCRAGRRRSTASRRWRSSE